MAINIQINGNGAVAFKLSKYPQQLKDDLVNNLNKQGAPIVRRNIKRGMPVSNKTSTHMKNANSLEVRALGNKGGYRNIGFYIQPHENFWYMKFTNNGSGTSRGKQARQFIQRGVKASTSSINRIVSQTIKSQKF